MRLFILAASGLVAALILGSMAFAQEVTLEDAQAEFGDLTRSEIEAMGYVVDAVCVDASEIPAFVLEAMGITATAAMGFHAVDESLFDATVDALEPEVILLGPNDEVWGVEYEATADAEDPTVLGQAMPLLEGGHPGMEFEHYAMHAWFIDNPAGQFADFNPAVSCATGAPETGVGPDAASGTRDAVPLVQALLAAIAGGMLLAGGWTLRRRFNR